MAACCREDTHTEKQMLAPHNSSVGVGKREAAAMCLADTRLKGQVGIAENLFYLGANSFGDEARFRLAHERVPLRCKQTSPLQLRSSKGFHVLEEN